jgi:peptidyl-prolyl cis-trans isomerase SurA
MLTLCAVAIVPAIAAAADVIDEPLAVVADRLILRSEWQTQVSLLAMQTKRDANDPQVRDSLGPVILERMINDELILIQAQRDTTISVKPEEIDQALADHIQSLKDQFAGEDEFQKELSREGLSERDLRVRYRREVRNQLMKQKLVQRKLGEVTVSNGEVRDFYRQFKDSLPVQPEGAKLAHILLPIEPSPGTIDSAKARVTRILQEITDGLDFAAAAKRYSEDPTAEKGGDLGWFGKGEMVPTFEAVAFALTTGQISGVVSTRYGFHLIQCIERSGDRLHARHILVTLNPTGADSTIILARADSIAQSARNGADYCQLASTYSQDEESQKNCGELGWFPIDEMVPEFKASLVSASIGEIVGPVSTKFGLHILRLLERRPRRAFDLTQDWDSIKEMARREKTNRVVADWIAEIRQDTYVSIRPISGRTTITP